MVKRRSAEVRRFPPSTAPLHAHYSLDPEIAQTEASMTALSDLHREVETALTRAPEKFKSGRYAVYVPGAVILGTYGSKNEARDAAMVWANRLDGVVVLDRGAVGDTLIPKAFP